jgi:photosystem II stability/assembly factor-like uncharacterized protein
MQICRSSLFLFVAATIAAAQSPPSATNQSEQQVWQMQDSGTTAGLRGIDSVDGTVAWASGTEGTVMRTTDGGAHWTKCAVPDAAKDGATLDFRGVQAWDATTAIVMASGPGDKSRLYKTTDGCGIWKALLENPDKDGFWDAVKFSGSYGILLGDPVDGEFEFWSSRDAGDSWSKGPPSLNAMLTGVMHHRPMPKNEAVFAASNSALFFNLQQIVFVTGGPSGSRLLLAEHIGSVGGGGAGGSVATLPLTAGSESAGAFSIASADWQRWVVVGGDFRKPEDTSGTAAYSANPGDRWHPAKTPPHGYRSTVQWSEPLKLWITAGANGSDISRDDGKTWQSLDNGNWNALSLPFIVGPKGRIARLNAKALSHP